MKNILLPLIILAMMASCGNQKTQDTSLQDAIIEAKLKNIEKDCFFKPHRTTPSYHRVAGFHKAVEKLLSKDIDEKNMEDVKKELLSQVRILCEKDNRVLLNETEKMIPLLKADNAKSDILTLESYVLVNTGIK